MNESHINRKSGQVFIVFTLLLLILNGCGSVLDGDYKQVTGIQGNHPFKKNNEHGHFLNSNGLKLSECTSCHGKDLKGVDNGVVNNGNKDLSCFTCHNSTQHNGSFSGSFTNHVTYIKDNNWEAASCFPCHSITPQTDDLTFGSACKKCHSAIDDRACNLCHAYDDPVDWSEDGTGMHQSHLGGFDGDKKNYKCSVCHIKPQSLNSAGHLGDDTEGSVEVIFGRPAINGNFQPTYNSENKTCDNVYCHGGNPAIWDIPGGWGVGGECSSACHEKPPISNHTSWPTINQCYFCHGDVINQDGTIKNHALHVNGSAN